MKSKHILITGASSGLGKELARQLLNKGNRLSLLARRDFSIADLGSPMGSRSTVLTFKGDVSNYDDMQRFVVEAEAQFGPLDIAIANAGVAHHVYAPNLDMRLVKEMLDTNLLGVIHMVGAVTPSFLSRGRGHVVGISSLTSYMRTIHYSVYGATKAAVSSYLHSLRLELEPRGIQVTVISPGFIKTPMTAANAFEMPFLLDVERAARKIVQMIEKERDQSNFPQPIYRGIQLLNLLPKRLFQTAMRKLRF